MLTASPVMRKSPSEVSRVATTSPVLTPSLTGTRSPSAGLGGDAISQFKRRGERPQYVVAVRLGQSKNSHHGVSDKLFGGSAVGGHDLPGECVLPAEQGAHVLGIERLAELGRAGHVGEEDRDDPAFFRHRESRCSAPLPPRPR
jgi:hypothetical protein